MKIRIEIRYLPNVEDPEALSIKRNLDLTGYKGIENVSSYRVYEFETSLNREDSLKMLNEISEKILTNPVIQEYKMQEISD